MPVRQATSSDRPLPQALPIDLAYLQSRYAMPYDDAQRAMLRLLDTGVVTLETEGENPDQNIYRVGKKTETEDLSLE